MSSQAPVAVPIAASASVAGPVHHWRIDEANGPTSLGICKVCGEAKKFRNWLAETDFSTHTEHELVA